MITKYLKYAAVGFGSILFLIGFGGKINLVREVEIFSYQNSYVSAATNKLEEVKRFHSTKKRIKFYSKDKSFNGIIESYSTWKQHYYILEISVITGEVDLLNGSMYNFIVASVSIFRYVI